MPLCYFGGYDPRHPRNRVILSGLAKRGVKVVECQSRHPMKPFRVWSLVRQFWRVRDQVELVVVGSCGHKYVPLAWLLSRMTGKPLAFDAFVSVFETRREKSRKGFLSGLGDVYARLVDRISGKLADVVLLDTEEHATYFCEQFRLPKSKVMSVQVGADVGMLAPPPPAFGGLFRVMFAGSFLPLHGTDVIVKAADYLESEPEVVVELFGDGEERSNTERLSHGRQVVFKPPVPYPEYLRLLSQRRVALGVFGTTPKTERVIPCKIYDSLGVGVPVITADTPAVRRILTHKQNALLVPAGDPMALAEAILLLKRDSALRERLAREGRRTYEEVGRPEIVARRMLEALESLNGHFASMKGRSGSSTIR